jgi:hypothetical protein
MISHQDPESNQGLRVLEGEEEIGALASRDEFKNTKTRVQWNPLVGTWKHDKERSADEVNFWWDERDHGEEPCCGHVDSFLTRREARRPGVDY